MANIDFQPVFNSDEYFSQEIYAKHTIKSKKWKSILPDGGPLPADAQQYFSPVCVWTRFPNNKSNAMLYLVGQALNEYVTTYSTAVIQAQPQGSADDVSARIKQLEDYLTYRALKDPAKNMLSAGFGKQWTETCLSEIVFPKSVLVV